MTTRYFAEEPCEHGWVGIHWLSPDDDRTAADHSRPPCLGGQRRELTGVDTFDVVDSPPRVGPHGEWSPQEPHIVSGKIDPARCLLPVGRYAIIPLDDPAV